MNLKNVGNTALQSIVVALIPYGIVTATSGNSWGYVAIVVGVACQLLYEYLP